MPGIFDEANKATEEMFANEEQLPVEEEIPTEEAVEETPLESTEEQIQEQPTQEQVMLDEAVNTAEIAAQTAQQKDAELQQVLQELEALKAQNQQMQGTISELSKQNEEKLIEEAMLPPTLDINGLAFADEETIAQAQADFAQKMAEYNRHQIMKELEPTLAYAKKGMQEAERTDVLNALSQLPELQGIGDMMPQIDRIISNNKWLQSEDMPMEEKIINAFAIGDCLLLTRHST